VLPEKHDVRRFPAERAVKQFGIAPYIGDKNLLAFLTERFFNGLKQSGSNSAVQRVRIHHKLTQISSEPEIVGTDKPENSRSLPIRKRGLVQSGWLDPTVSSDHQCRQNPGKLCMSARICGMSELVVLRSMAPLSHLATGAPAKLKFTAEKPAIGNRLNATATAKDKRKIKT